VGCDIDLLIGNMECATAIRKRGGKQMTDRELLELAAKAGGEPWIDDSWPQDLPGLMLDFGNGTTQWNPLDDDGDALQLKVHIRRCDDKETVAEKVLDNPLAAARRAIVRAAAEIGRNMK
jgi:hypothetical protein